MNERMNEEIDEGANGWEEIDQLTNKLTNKWTNERLILLMKEIFSSFLSRQ